jgi:hypothetical protein
MRENRGEEGKVVFLAGLGGILPVSWAALSAAALTKFTMA